MYTASVSNQHTHITQRYSQTYLENSSQLAFEVSKDAASAESGTLKPHLNLFLRA